MSDQQVRMMPTKFLWPCEVFEFDTPEVEQEPQAKKVSSSCGRYNQHISVRVPSTVEGGTRNKSQAIWSQ